MPREFAGATDSDQQALCRHEAYADVAIAGGAIQRKSGLYSRSKAPASGAADAAPSRLGASRWKMRSSERAQRRQQRNAPYCQPKGMTRDQATENTAEAGQTE